MQTNLLAYGLHIPRYVYHITTVNKAMAILKEGLMPGMPASETAWDGQDYWPDETPIEALARDIMNDYLPHGHVWFAWPDYGQALECLRGQSNGIRDYVMLAIDIEGLPVNMGNNSMAEIIFSLCYNLASEGFDTANEIPEDLLDMVNDLEISVANYKNQVKPWNGETSLDGARPELLIGQTVEPDKIRRVL